MAIETEKQTRIINRSDFGPGDAGELAYETVLEGYPCEKYIDAEFNKCGKPPIGTVDIDVQGNLLPLAYCSDECAKELTKQVEDEARSKGEFTWPGRNGFGRA